MTPHAPLAVLLAASTALIIACVEAATRGDEPAGDSPPWLAKLFPYTGQPGRCKDRLRRVDAREIALDNAVAGRVTVELRYPDLHGEDATGLARIYVPALLKTDSAARLPLIHSAGYELDEASAVRLAARGYVVSTPHAHPLNPLGRGVNLDVAILHAARALPLVDPLRVGIQGGSAGGWMTLMLAAESFPLLYSMPDVPPMHWGYNAAYIAENQALAGPPPGSDKPRMPVLQIVGPIAEQSKELYGQPYDHPTYLAVSPISHMEAVTAPCLITFSTADMLVPIEQVGREFVRKPGQGKFPRGFWSALTARFPGIRGRRTLMEVLPSSSSVLVVPAPSGIPRLSPDGLAQGVAHRLAIPFDRDKTVTVVILDEGPKEPDVGHFKYAWALDHEPFRHWAEERGVQAHQLTLRKLERLMKRWLGEPWGRFTVRRSGHASETPGNALDYPEAERADVLLGLKAYAQNDERALRLASIYEHLPGRLKVLGPHLGKGDAGTVRRTLDAAAGKAGDGGEWVKE